MKKVPKAFLGVPKRKIRVSKMQETLMNGGERGIRTLERVLAVTRFPILLDNVTIAKINTKCLKIIIDKNGLNLRKIRV